MSKHKTSSFVIEKSLQRKTYSGKKFRDIEDKQKDRLKISTEIRAL
jgi:hypothetical protein